MSKERMDRAFDAAARGYREILKNSRPDDARVLDGIEPREIVEVRGEYDHIDRVLRATGVPFTSVTPEQLEDVDWFRMKVLWINCPGRISARSLRQLAPWVRAGGHLATTDWALKNVLEPAFPGRVRHNGQGIPDSVVKVEGRGDHPFLRGFVDDGRDPLWWMEGASYPCEVLDRENVRVLVRSPEVGSRFGSDAVVVEWNEGEGSVVHLVSHLYLQRSETRNARDREGAGAYFKSMGLTDDVAARCAAEAGDALASELKSAFTTAGLASELILRKKLGRRD